MKTPSIFFFTYITIGMLISYGCTVTEETAEDAQGTAEEFPELLEESVSQVPDWYRATVSSDADSASLYGYAYSVSADSADAVSQAKHTAEKYLRFEVDRHLESVRAEMEANGYQPASDPAFIIQLRNTAAKISFAQPANTEIEHILNDENRNEIYARHMLTRNELYALLENHLSDQEFLEKARESQ